MAIPEFNYAITHYIKQHFSKSIIYHAMRSPLKLSEGSLLPPVLKRKKSLKLNSIRTCNDDFTNATV